MSTLPKIPKLSSTAKFRFGVMSTLVFILAIGIWALLSSAFSIKRVTEIKTKQKEYDLSASTSYKELAEKQRLESEQRYKNLEKNITVSEKKLRGKVTLPVVLVYPKQISAQDFAKIKSNLTSSGTSTSSINYVKTFLEQEAKKFNVSDLELEVVIKGPYAIDAPPSLGDVFNHWGKDVFATADFVYSFNKVISNNNLGYTAETPVVFVYFDNNKKNAPDYVYSKADLTTFRSFTIGDKNRAFVNIYNFDPSISSHYVLTVAHEALHLFNARDKYNESSYTCKDTGLGNPDKSPLYPQTTADIMCLLVAKSPSSWIYGSFANNSITINENTAKELGWKD